MLSSLCTCKFRTIQAFGKAVITREKSSHTSYNLHEEVQSKFLLELRGSTCCRCLVKPVAAKSINVWVPTLTISNLSYLSAIYWDITIKQLKLTRFLIAFICYLQHATSSLSSTGNLCWERWNWYEKFWNAHNFLWWLFGAIKQCAHCIKFNYLHLILLILYMVFYLL